jgi:hypothetical protein
MKQNISGSAAIALIVVAVLAVLFFGWRYVSGGPDADVTQQNIDHWKQMAKQPPTNNPNAASQNRGSR